MADPPPPPAGSARDPLRPAERLLYGAAQRSSPAPLADADVEKQQALVDPADGWNTARGVFDIKRWYVGIITPDFRSDEARIRCGSLKRVDAAPTAQEAKLRRMRATSEELNANPARALEKPFAERWFGSMDAASASSTLAASALGAGNLAMPYAFALTGVGLGLLTLVFVGLISAISLQILMVAARYTDTQSYAAIFELSVGHWSAARILDMVMLLNGIGSIICILIFEGDFLPPAAASLPFGLSFHLSRTAAILGAGVLVWPLILSPNISALRHVMRLVPLVLIVTIMIVASDTPHFAHETRQAGYRVEMWHFEPKKWLHAVAIMVNAFQNHQNAIPVANQLDRPSIARIVKSTVNGNMLVLSLLAALGLSGYISFGSSTKGDFLLNYPQGRAEILVCRVILSVFVYLVLPGMLLPTANSAAQLYQSMFGKSNEEEAHPFLHACCATALLLSCTVAALHVTDVASVIGVLGGLFAATMMFWFPCAVYKFLLWPTQPAIFRKPVLFCLLTLGVLSWISVAAMYLL